MPNESIKPKLTASDKITAILNRLPIGEAIEIYNEAGKQLHERIEKDQQELLNHKNKLSKKES